MPKGYVILTEAVKDRAGWSSTANSEKAMAGAMILSVDQKPQVIEGAWHGDQTVVLVFDSVDAAHTWYESEGYQNAAKLRQAAADCNAVIVSGFEMPSAPK